MRTMTIRRWAVALLVSFLITGSLWALVMTYFLYLPTFSGMGVHKEDQWVFGQLQNIATNAFFIALTSGLILGFCLRGACRRITHRPEPSAEPDASPNCGPGRRLGDSGVGGGPPSLS